MTRVQRCGDGWGRARGFTLIDVMVTLAVVGILTTVAYFSFGSAVTKSKRAECKNALLAVAQNQERYFTSNNTYASTLAQLNMTAYSGSSAGASACTLSDPVADSNQPAGPTGVMTSFVASATARFTDSQCGTTWTINNLNQKTPDPGASNAVPGQCW